MDFRPVRFLKPVRSQYVFKTDAKVLVFLCILDRIWHCLKINTELNLHD